MVAGVKLATVIEKVVGWLQRRQNHTILWFSRETTLAVAVFGGLRQAADATILREKELAERPPRTAARSQK